MINEQSVVNWFSSRKNTAIFFTGCLLVGTLIGVYQIMSADTPKKIDGPASFSCKQAQPAKEFAQITEFFILNCSHCEKTEQYVSKIPGGVIRRHLVWDYSTENMARMVFALGKMDRDDAIHLAQLAVLSEKWVFDYISEDARRFASENDLDIVKLSALSISPAATAFIEETRQIQKACGIIQAPAMLKSGVVVTPVGAGGYRQMVDRTAGAASGIIVN